MDTKSRFLKWKRILLMGQTRNKTWQGVRLSWENPPLPNCLDVSVGSGWRIVIAREGAKPQKDATSCNPRKGRTGSTPVGYSGRTALRREQCNGFHQRIAGQWLRKHGPIRKNRTTGLCLQKHMSRDGYSASLLARWLLPTEVGLRHSSVICIRFCFYYSDSSSCSTLTD
jgi:hypothetical protein